MAENASRSGESTRLPVLELRVRSERPGDEEAIFALHEAAFVRAQEAELVGVLRREADPYLGLVAELGSELVGHVAFSPVALAGEGPAALALGPMAVAPPVQGRGVGSALIAAGLEACAARGVGVVFVLGHADYYPRFGFRPAAVAALRYRSEVFDGVFFVRELEAGSLAGRTGLVRYHPAFDRL